ncbi:putative protein TPRXL [Stylophora pistillata]|nr:putative protein TPRXL [Stylophora pistillata]
MKALQLSAICLSIVISIYWNYVQTGKRGPVKDTKKDQFMITGKGTTKGGKTKIIVYMQTTGENPINPALARATVDSAKATSTPSAIIKSSSMTSAGFLSSSNSAKSTPAPQSSGVVPVKSKQAATSGSPGPSPQPSRKQPTTSSSSASSPPPDQSSSQASVQPSATNSTAIQSSSVSSLAPSSSSPPAVISSTSVSLDPSATKNAVPQVSSLASVDPFLTLSLAIKSPSAGASSAAVTQTSSLPGSSASSSPGSTITPAKSSPTNPNNYSLLYI